MARSMGRCLLTIAGLFALSSGLCGCASSTESAQRDELTAHVGVYPPPAGNIPRVRVGVPKFQVTDPSIRGENLEVVAADQLTSLAFQTQRFSVIERAQLDQMLREQNLEGIVRDGELAQAGQVRGVDYLFVGKVTNLRVKKEKAGRGLGLARVTRYVGGLDFEKKSVTIKVDCGVDLRLVDPTSGEIVAAHFGEYQRTDAASAFGLDILGASASADVDLKIDKDNKGKILRLALDESLRKMLPAIDQSLLARAASPGSVQPASGTTPSASGTPAFCSGCGGKLVPGAKFCAGCGNKVQQ